MKLPHSTTKISGIQILFGLFVILGIPLYVLWPSTAVQEQDACMDGSISSWVGEYPEPVLVIRESITLQGSRNFCFDKSVSCTIAPMIIHPWVQNSDLRYATKMPEVRYQLQETVSSDLNDYPQGQELFFEGELSTEECAYRVGMDRWTGACSELQKMRLVAGDPNKEGRSFFLAPCSEGYSAWMEVQSSLFDDLRIQKGVIKGYGIIAEQ